MKKILIPALMIAATAPTLVAAPDMTPDDVSEDTLRDMATDRQKASMESHDKATAKAEEEREKAIKEAKEVTERNDAGLKKTIQKRHLNSMLPPCDREPESPREPGDYHIRY